MKDAPSCVLAAAMTILAQSLPAAASGLSSYAVGSIPVAGGIGDLEFPVTNDLKLQFTLGILSQGTYADSNPFAHFALFAPAAWLHWDGVDNVRLSAGLQEGFGQSISELGLPATREDRLMARARLQQPRGSGAIYEMLQLDLRSFDDVTGVHRWVLRPRFRLGTGFNLDATRVHTLVLYQEFALRFAEASYTKRAFEFYRAVAGYTWTTRRGVFVTAGMIGQLTLSPAGTRLDLLWGPVLSFAYRILPQKPSVEAPPEPPEIETP
jgi:hypothetical protein